MSLEYFSTLTQYGDVYELTYEMDSPYSFVKWTEENFKYVTYNPRKSVNREGLSITSLDGSMSGVPDLDSLTEYNKENNTTYSEKDFIVTTPVYEHVDLQNCISEFKDYMYRTHILKLNPGGFFPPHRDSNGFEFDSFRLIVPLKNTNPPAVNFIVDNKLNYWNEGRMYFVNTAKVHTLFNAGFKPSYWLVLNINTTKNAVEKVLKAFLQK